MKFRVARDEFAESVTWVARSLPSRPPVPVLGCVVLTAGDIEPGRDGLTVSGFDYEVSAEETISAEVAEPGRVLVSGRLLADITKALPHKPVDVSLDGSRVAISCGSAKFSLPTMPVEDYPEMPKVPDVTGSLPAGIFAEAITQVAVAAGRDDTLPMLTGVRLEIEGNIVPALNQFSRADCTSDPCTITETTSCSYSYDITGHRTDLDWDDYEAVGGGSQGAGYQGP